MKRIVFLLLILVVYLQSVAQVGIGTLNPDSSAILHLESSRRGLLIPRMIKSDRDNIPSPATGLMIFQTDVNPGFYFYNGNDWMPLAGDNDWLFNGEHIYKANDGNVGIGTDSPTTLLHVDFSQYANIVAFDDGFEDGNLSPFASSDPAWFVQNAQANGGSYAAQSADISDNETTSISVNVYVPAGGSDFNFAYKVSSEENYDFLVFYIDGNSQEQWSGDVDWTVYSGNLSEGAHTLEWRYEKDGSVSRNDDAAWIDDIHIDRVYELTPVFRLVDGMQADGKVLMSDADGNATWQDPENAGVSKWIQKDEDIYNANSGNVGIGLTDPAYKLHVQAGASGSYLLYVDNLSGDENSYGIYGRVASSNSFHSAGILGYQPGDYAIGVLGDYGIWGAAVVGLGWGAVLDSLPTYTDIGVYGAADYDDVSTGIYGYDPDPSEGYAGYFDGNLAVTGTKSASVPTSRGNQLVYSVESPEIWFEDFGSGKLQNGHAHIRLDDTYLETVYIDHDHPMHVFVQEQGDCNGLYVIPDADGRGFTVKEKQGGTSSIPFSYRIVAKRRFYQDHRFGIDMLRPLENNLEKAKYHKPFSVDLNQAKKKREDLKRNKYKAQNGPLSRNNSAPKSKIQPE